MNSRVVGGAWGRHLDLSPLFPPEVFAFLTLRDSRAGVSPEALAGFLGERGLPGVRVHAVRQVHSGEVVEASRCPCEADGILVRSPMEAARVVAADCVPILLARRDGSACAAVHSGWRGTLSRIVSRAAESLSGSGAQPLVAYLGPAVGPCCYAVPAERVETFRNGFGPLWREPPEGGDRLDLCGLNRALLLDGGLDPGDIHAEGLCTACRPDLFCSFRRDGDAAGRMAAVIGLLPRTPHRRDP